MLSAPPVSRQAVALARARAATVRRARGAFVQAMDGRIFSPRANQLIVYALVASIAIHAALLAIRFRLYDPKSLLDRTPPLEVALVNAKSKARPAVADILAQANLDGGGNTDAKRRARTPMPVLPKAGAGGEIAVAAQRLTCWSRRRAS